METNNNEILLAKSSEDILIDIPQNAVLITENALTKKSKEHSNSGIWFSFPGIFYNTLIFTTPVTIQYAEEKYNAIDMPEVKVIPQITYRVTKPLIFYKQVCGRNVSKVDINSNRLKGIYDVIKVAIRNIVTTCTFKELERFSLKTMQVTETIENYIIDNVSEQTEMIIAREFTNVENTYGIKIMNLGFGDVTLNDVVQQAQLDAEKAKFDAKAMVEESKGKLQAAENEAAAIDIKIKAYLKAGLSKEDIAKILIMEKTNGGTVIMGTNNTDAMLAQLINSSNNQHNNQNNNQNNNQDNNPNGMQYTHTL